eukprot:PRCOL_00001037-RA
MLHLLLLRRRLSKERARPATVAEAASVTPPWAPSPKRGDFKSMKVLELKEFLEERGIGLNGAVERAELEALCEAAESAQKPSRPDRAHGGPSAAEGRTASAGGTTREVGPELEKAMASVAPGSVASDQAPMQPSVAVAAATAVVADAADTADATPVMSTTGVGASAPNGSRPQRYASADAAAAHKAAATADAPFDASVQNEAALSKRVAELERELDESVEAALIADDQAIGFRIQLEAAEGGLRRYGREAEELRNELRRVNDVMGSKLREMGHWQLLYDCGIGMMVSSASAAVIRAWLRAANPDHRDREDDQSDRESPERSSPISSSDLESDMDTFGDGTSYIEQMKIAMAASREDQGGGSGDRRVPPRSQSSRRTTRPSRNTRSRRSAGASSRGQRDAASPAASESESEATPPTPDGKRKRLAELKELPLMQKLRAMRASKEAVEEGIRRAQEPPHEGEREYGRLRDQGAERRRRGREKGDMHRHGDREHGWNRERARDGSAAPQPARHPDGAGHDNEETPRAAALRDEISRMERAKRQARSKETALVGKLNALQRRRDESERHARALAEQVKEIEQERNMWEKEGKVVAERAKEALTARASARQNATGAAREAFYLQAAADYARAGPESGVGDASAFAEAQKSAREWESSVASKSARARRLSSDSSDAHTSEEETAKSAKEERRRYESRSGGGGKGSRRRATSIARAAAASSQSPALENARERSSRRRDRAAPEAPPSEVSAQSSAMPGKVSTRIFSAARHGRQDELAMLLAEVDTDAAGVRDRFLNTPLIVASQNNRKRACRAALRGGVDVNAANKHGNTALHYAFAYSYFEVADYLISKGANTSLKNKAGQTPIEAGGTPIGPMAELVRSVTTAAAGRGSGRASRASGTKGAGGVGRMADDSASDSDMGDNLMYLN